MKQIRHGRLRLALVLGAIAAGGAIQGALHAAESAEFARAPYLQMSTPNSIVIVWRWRGAMEPVLKYGTDPANLDRTARERDVVTRVALPRDLEDATEEERELLKPRFARLPKLHSASPGLVQYEVPLQGLMANTRYYYAIFDGAARLTAEDRSYTFVTHPQPGQDRPARIWVVGDSGVGREPQTSVHLKMVELTDRQDRPLDFFIHVGDMAYSSGRDREFQSRFFDMYEPTLRRTVCWPAMGNHEGITSKGISGTGPYYDAYVVPTRGEAGGLPSGTEAYYSFDYGQAHFICLDSHDLDRSPNGAMARWLKADLERVRSRWLIAYWHHPPYTKGSHDSDRERQLREMRTEIMPIMESGGVDVVLTGHSHIYERSMLMDGAYATPTVAEYVILDDGDGDPKGDGAYRKSAGLHPNQGTVQIVAGHGGTGLSRKGTMPVMKRILLEHGSVLLDIGGDTLSGLMLNKDGEIRDEFSLVKRGTVTPTRLSNPRQLPPYTPPPPRSNDGGLEAPDDFIVLIEKNAVWQYMTGPSRPPEGWVGLTFNAAGWKSGKAGFGYSDDRVYETELTDMKRNYTTVFARRDFVVENADSVSKLGVMMDYDDAFIVYLNGQEVLRKGVRTRGNGELRVSSHESNGHHFYPFSDAEQHVRAGRNVIAIEAYNRSADSSDFTLDPYLIMED